MLAFDEIIDPRDDQHLTAEFASMPSGEAWTRSQPYLISAAMALSAGQHGSCAAALDAADGLLERLDVHEDAPARLAAAVIGSPSACAPGNWRRPHRPSAVRS